MPKTPNQLGRDDAIGLSDLELVEQTFDVIGEATDSDDVGDPLWILVDEMVERWAPDVARADIERRFKDDPDPDLQINGALEGLRLRQAARLLRDTLQRGDDDAS